MTGAPLNESCVGGLTKTGCVGTKVYQKINYVFYILLFLFWKLKGIVHLNSFLTKRLTRLTNWNKDVNVLFSKFPFSLSNGLSYSIEGFNNSLLAL